MPTGNRIGQLYLFELLKEQPSKGLPLPMQYLGSKARIAGWIIEESKKIFPHCHKFFDLFSGTGIIAVQALANGYTVSANDFEEYSFRIMKSLLSTSRSCLDDLIGQLSDLNDESRLLNGDRSFMRGLLEQEKLYFNLTNHRDFRWEEYNDFSEKTPIISGSNTEIDELRQKRQWNLFSHYYANTYFGIKQCLQLDSLRELAEKQNECARNHLLAATVSAMTFGVSSTTHLAQYFRPSSRLGTLQLIKRRQFDFISEVQQRLVQLKHFDLPRTESNIYNLDYLSAMERENLDETWIVYADPPYFKEHYSRYYHVLNTFCLYDYPYLTFNPITKQITRGRYRTDRNVSDFGRKASVKTAFSRLFNSCKQRNFRLVLSYANTSLVEKHLILRLATEVGLRSVTSEITLMHSSQGKYSNKTVTEYLFCFEAEGH
jgi:adenine-specific DNA-methyltransferase